MGNRWRQSLIRETHSWYMRKVKCSETRAELEFSIYIYIYLTITPSRHSSLVDRVWGNHYCCIVLAVAGLSETQAPTCSGPRHPPQTHTAGRVPSPWSVSPAQDQCQDIPQGTPTTGIPTQLQSACPSVSGEFFVWKLMFTVYSKLLIQLCLADLQSSRPECCIICSSLTLFKRVKQRSIIAT